MYVKLNIRSEKEVEIYWSFIKNPYNYQSSK